ncbi:hypothetical protein PVAG01_04115 [Phlyctema vagabunda]|uniref:Uncharacterized protein n=1 Tax=Phlyctema vagabunda TaxID=108571 RepID=A0ABR4PND7_9HELO
MIRCRLPGDDLTIPAVGAWRREQEPQRFTGTSSSEVQKVVSGRSSMRRRCPWRVNSQISFFRPKLNHDDALLVIWTLDPCQSGDAAISGILDPISCIVGECERRQIMEKPIFTSNELSTRSPEAPFFLLFTHDSTAEHPGMALRQVDFSQNPETRPSTVEFPLLLPEALLTFFSGVSSSPLISVVPRHNTTLVMGNEGLPAHTQQDTTRSGHQI